MVNLNYAKNRFRTLYQVSLSKFGVLNLLQKRFEKEAEKAFNGGDNQRAEKMIKNPIPSAKAAPLALVDQSGRAVNFCPVTVWSGDKVNPETWNIQNLKAERVLFADKSEKVFEEVEEWVDSKDIKKIFVPEEVIEMELEMSRLLSPPLPFLLSEAVTEIVSSTEVAKLHKLESLLRNPAFASKFISYLSANHINGLQSVCRQCPTPVYSLLLKTCVSDGHISLLEEVFDLINDSTMWPEFGFKLMTALDMRVEVSFQLLNGGLTANIQANKSAYLQSIMNCHSEFHERFGLPNETDFHSNPGFAEFFRELIRAQTDIFIDLFTSVANRPQNKELMLNIIEMNNQNMFNTRMLETASKSQRGCNALVQLFNLSGSPADEVVNAVEDKSMLKCAKGKEVFQPGFENVCLHSFN